MICLSLLWPLAGILGAISDVRSPVWSRSYGLPKLYNQDSPLHRVSKDDGSTLAGDRKGKILGLGEQFLTPGIQRIALPIVGYTLILFFLIQGPIFFPEQWAKWETVTIIYAMFLVPGLIFAVMNIHPFNIAAWKTLLWFGIAFAGAFILFKLLLSGLTYEVGFPIGSAIPTVVYQVFVISYAEESFFRGFLLEIGKSRAGIGIIASSLMFSVFHLAAYSAAGLNFFAFFIAIAMGFAFGLTYIATRHFGGIGIPWGLHAGFNLALLFG